MDDDPTMDNNLMDYDIDLPNIDFDDDPNLCDAARIDCDYGMIS